VILRVLQSLLFKPDAASAGGEQLLDMHARDQSNAWLTHGTQLMTTGQLGEAARAFRESLHACADNSTALLNLAAIVMDDDPEAAVRHLRMAEKLAPADAGVQTNLGTALMYLGRLDEARQSYLQALALDPANAAARYNMATVNLAEGRFGADTWGDFRARWRHEGYCRDFLLGGVPYLGGEEPPRGRVLVHLEQGLGDEICYAGCIGDLRAHASAVALVCEPRLQGLLAASFPGVCVIGRSAGWQAQARAFAPDSQIYAGDLGYWFRRGSAGFPAPRAYLGADPARRERWRARLRALGGGTLKIGISWRGGTATTGRNVRSIPLWEWAPLLGLPGIDWIDLQYGEHQHELRAAQESGVAITRFDDAIADYHETAALVSELDLVISVATAVVDLAGALGKPCWVLVPQRPLWKFGVQGERTPWYPSLRLFRQGGQEQWSSVLRRVAARLEGAADQGERRVAPTPAQWAEAANCLRSRRYRAQAA
jgi:tetratricopeptide (TPR) repeat protein